MCVDLSKKSPTLKNDFSSFFSNCSIFTPPKKTSHTLVSCHDAAADRVAWRFDGWVGWPWWWLRLFSRFSPVKRWYLLFRLTHQSTTVSNAVRTFSLEPMHDVVKRIYTCEPMEVYLVCNVYNTWQKYLLTKKKRSPLKNKTPGPKLKKYTPGSPNNHQVLNGLRWWFPAMSYGKIWNHPIEPTIYKWLFLGYLRYIVIFAGRRFPFSFIHGECPKRSFPEKTWKDRANGKNLAKPRCSWILSASQLFARKPLRGSGYLVTGYM